MELPKKCSRCHLLQLMVNFKAHKKTKDGLCPQFIICRKISIRKFIKKFRKKRTRDRNKIGYKRKQTDINFRLIFNIKSRIYLALSGKSKSSSTKDVLGIDIDTYGRWIA